MPKLFLTLFWIVVSCCIASGKPLMDAQKHFDKGEFSQGVRILKSKIADKKLAKEKRLESAEMLAYFYRDQVGEYTLAIRYMQKAVHLASPDHSEKMQQFQQTVVQWQGLEKKFQKLSRKIRQLKVQTYTRQTGDEKLARQQFAENIESFKKIIRENPDYHRLHEVYYVQGLTYQVLELHHAAADSFAKALNLKPGMSLSKPVEKLRDEARLQWLLNLGRLVAWSVAGILNVILALSFFLSAPWRWLRWQHLVFGTLLVLTWIVVFQLSSNILGTSEDSLAFINSDGVYTEPVYIQTGPDSPGEKIVQSLFYYGFAGVCAIFLFSIATGRIRKRWIAGLVNVTFSTLLLTSLTTLYYIDYCQANGRYYPIAGSQQTLPHGYFAYQMSDPEPYLLTNPLYYQRLDLSSIDDPKLVEWLLRQKITGIKLESK